MAIVVKMRQDSVDLEKIQIFSVVNGLSKPASTRNRKTTPMHRGGRRASKALQKIHWNTVAEEKLDGSLWASQENAEDDINDSEIARLEDLFGVSPINKNAGQKKPTIKKNTKMPTSLIDPKRAVSKNTRTLVLPIHQYSYLLVFPPSMFTEQYCYFIGSV